MRDITGKFRLLKWIALTSFVLQIIIPAGYMPAALSSGWFVKLCPEGLSPVAMQILHGEHAEHSAHQDEVVSASQYDCSFAALSDELASATVAALVLPLVANNLLLRDFQVMDVVKFTATYRSRAPPGTKSA